ncbi:MAG: hypothetical protein L0332_31290 [Chloroflexi bacterium]|nr:hypothetical protein [Chloroflexota bacterium]MCI0650103.1 hypothetical protein [Chloroflexota bacterium]MCI0731187.1 hypothetical protein [Chloroflexota bacterium]
MFTLLVTWLAAGRPLVQAQAQNGITSPVPGDVLSGLVVVQGTAADPNFLRYELAFSRDGSEWIVFAQGDQQVVGGALAVWDTTVGRSANRPVFPDGLYQLRLRVVRQDYNYGEYYVNDLIVANDTATPSPTPTVDGPAGATTPRPQPGPTLPATFQVAPGLLPSLTPFPTPTRQPTPANQPLDPAGNNPGDGLAERPGLLERLTAIDTGSFGRAFWQGVIVVGYAFAFLAFYLLLRAIVRRVWRLVWTRLQR